MLWGGCRFEWEWGRWITGCLMHCRDVVLDGMCEWGAYFWCGDGCVGGSGMMSVRRMLSGGCGFRWGWGRWVVDSLVQ